MPDSQASTIADSRASNRDEHTAPTKIDFSRLPPVYLITTHVQLAELVSVEDILRNGGGTITSNIKEAKLVLGLVSTMRRAKFELQSRKLKVTDAETPEGFLVQNSASVRNDRSPVRKRRKTSKESVKKQPALPNNASTTNSETEDDDEHPAKPLSQLSIVTISDDPSDLESDAENSLLPFVGDAEDIIRVVRIDWIREAVKTGKIPPIQSYIVYEGKRLPSEPEIFSEPGSPALKIPSSPIEREDTPFTKRSVAIGEVEHVRPKTWSKFGKRDRLKDAMQDEFQGRKFVSSTQQTKAGSIVTRPTALLHQTTSEHDAGADFVMPETPQWVKENKIYACERSTPKDSLNKAFINELEKIKLARELTMDNIGVRAYSTSIASIAAYPYGLRNFREILALPGCDQKIAHLFHEWHTTGQLEAVKELEADPVLQILKTFWNIWGVGAVTAREFYFDRGWRDLDDIIENGWSSLSRQQQVGVKFYDEFLTKVPRSEAEFIASVVTYHAKQIIDDGIECVIVGGFRRGNKEVGDVDIILSHRDEKATYELVNHVVEALEKSGWISHTLSLKLTNSHRNQQAVAMKFDENNKKSGFDTLDTALVVWQDPIWPTKEVDLVANPRAKNPNIHRRVDIIISPWRTVGCAIIGWSGGTTFQRDLRRYAKYVKGWKFDSSGVRERGNGKWVDLEQWTNPATRVRTWQEAEKRVFEGMGLEWRVPEERCTG
ncbi:MAG: hypothetical protein MMC33_004613 [Icmadophila ericetorum]|nr:hypothetical protein [Icmadophila ericetorum]